MGKEWSVAAEIRAEQRAALKGMPLKKKIAHYYEYYRLHAIIFFGAVLIIVSIVSSMATQKDYSFNAIFINSFHLASAGLSENFSIFAGLDTDNYNCVIDTGMILDPVGFSEFDAANAQRITAVAMAGDLDVIVADGYTFGNYAENGFFLDLRNIFDDDDFAYYQSRIFYIDQVVVDRRVNASREELIAEADRTIEEWDAELLKRSRPELMVNPVPVGIFVTDAPIIMETESYPGFDAVFGFIGNSSRLDTAMEFLTFLLSNEALSVLSPDDSP